MFVLLVFISILKSIFYIYADKYKRKGIHTHIYNFYPVLFHPDTDTLEKLTILSIDNDIYS